MAVKFDPKYFTLWDSVYLKHERVVWAVLKRDRLKVEVLRSGGEAQVKEHLPSKHEALSSNPILPKKKKVKIFVL
jgi:hypothetical protein